MVNSHVRSQIMIPIRKDPAERQGYLRYFYLDWRPTKLGRFWSRAVAWLSGMGWTPGILLTLQVKNRRTGELESTILAVVTHQGQQYLVSMLGGGSEWVQNVRAASGDAFVKRGLSRPVKLIEIATEARAPILKAWCQIATSGRKHIPVPYTAPISEFEAIAADYPAFRIDPTDFASGS
jgi:hypothetical protein